MKGKGKKPKQALFESSIIECILLFCFVFRLLFWSFLWNMSFSARGTLNHLQTALCCRDCVRFLTKMERCSPDANENKLLLFWLYGNVLKVQQKLLKNSHIIKWTLESLHLCWNWFNIRILLKKIIKRSFLIYVIPQTGSKNVQKLSLALKSTAHHYFRFAFIFLFGKKNPKPGKFHSSSSFYTKCWKNKAVLHYTVMECTCL